MNKSIIFFSLIISFYLHSAESACVARPKFIYVIMPGQNGEGGQSYNQDGIISNGEQKKRWIIDNGTTLHNGDKVTILETSTEWSKIDLGQGNCVKHFLEQFRQQSTTGSNILLYGVSQGTATVLNSLREMDDDERNAIKLIFLESVLGTPNSAIMHTTQKTISSVLTYLPFSRFWIVSIGGKILFPSFNPLWGMNALNSAQYVLDGVPVIIIHDTQDFQLNINDARKLYIELIKNGKNAYLFEIQSENGNHVHILGRSGDRQSMIAIQQIYCNHGLPYDQNVLDNASENESAIDLAKFKPSIEEVQARIRRNNPNFYRNIIDVTSLFLLAVFTYYQCLR